ncbi:hypothetical protein AB4072_11225 [Microvirga sp. 2MCAF38]|uniref:hypothetical protein n=1 Tax=Microvirga sp. 2MCAF38 TaxID=3232989 RepID=UPI003F987EFF
MNQPREPLFTSDAGKIVNKAVGATQTAFASEAGKALRAVIAKGPDGLMQHLAGVAEKNMPDPLAQARLRLAEQGQNFETMRGAIAKIGHSLGRLNETPDTEAERAHVKDLLNAQAEAIQGLTLLALKGQQAQADLIAAIDGHSRRPGSGMPKWIYYIMGVMMIWSLLSIVWNMLF